MTDVILFRQPSSETGTFGLWCIPKLNKIMYSIERPWADNRVNISCIPSGKYNVRYTMSPNKGVESYEIQNVIGRSGIRIDIANYVHELKGCIGLGLGICASYNHRGIINSEKAVKEFERLLMRQPFTLKIMWADY